MKILALETSSSRTSAALNENGTTVFSGSFFSPRRETGPVFSLAQRALDAAGGKIDRIAIGTGPGSYNGIRAGISLALGIASALDAPCAGFCSLLALADPELKIVAGDARSGQFFCAVIAGFSFLSPPSLLDKEALLSLRESYPDAKTLWIGDCPLSTSWLPAWPEAEQLARLAASSEELPHPSPLYLKPPHITPPRKK